MPSEGRGHRFESCRARQVISMSYIFIVLFRSAPTHQKLTKSWSAGSGCRLEKCGSRRWSRCHENGRIERVWGRKNHSAGSPVTIAEIASHRRCRTITASTSTWHDLSIRWIEDTGDEPTGSETHLIAHAGHTEIVVVLKERMRIHEGDTVKFSFDTAPRRTSSTRNPASAWRPAEDRIRSPRRSVQGGVSAFEGYSATRAMRS